MKTVPTPREWKAMFQAIDRVPKDQQNSLIEEEAARATVKPATVKRHYGLYLRGDPKAYHSTLGRPRLDATAPEAVSSSSDSDSSPSRSSSKRRRVSRRDSSSSDSDDDKPRNRPPRTSQNITQHHDQSVSGISRLPALNQVLNLPPVSNISPLLPLPIQVGKIEKGKNGIASFDEFMMYYRQMVTEDWFRQAIANDQRMSEIAPFAALFSNVSSWSDDDQAQMRLFMDRVNMGEVRQIWRVAVAHDLYTSINNLSTKLSPADVRAVLLDHVRAIEEREPSLASSSSSKPRK